jgi:transcriptional regulator with XRE-family HTH domain
MPTVGERIRGIREELGWTLEELADKSKVSKGFLSEVETNKRDISSGYLLRVANAVGASLDYLLRGDESSQRKNKPVEIPPELSDAAQQLRLKYSETLELLEAHSSVVARRSNSTVRRFTVEDWKRFHELIRKVYGPGG